jgi:beta-N-acetylhexosaminidase
VVDYQKSPFRLDDRAIAWVEETRRGLTVDEKVGQLFCPIALSPDPRYMDEELLRWHIGGVMLKTSPAPEIRMALDYAQRRSKVPLLCAANLEYGSPGLIAEGTDFGSQLLVAATGEEVHAYRLGKVSCTEGAAVGVNWAFAPVVDIDMNWRNPITNVRTYGGDADSVLAFARAYIKGADEAGLAVTVKHFPGDGVDEVDQHLQVGVNSLSCEEWDRTFGKVFSGLIDSGVLSVMAAHVALPAYQKRLNPALPDKLVPASLSYELLTGLLRERMGFNGVVVSDATPMVGFTSAMRRELAVPAAIMAGCDMFLFNKSLPEDFEYMKKGLAEGRLTAERLDEAVSRILAMKAALGLHKKSKEALVPGEAALSTIGSSLHAAWAAECADKGITLVKNTEDILPLDPRKHPRVLLELLGDFPSNERIERHFSEGLRREGFDVTLYEREDFECYAFGVKPFTDRYDLVIYLANVENASNMTTNRINWYTFWGHGDNVPWFVEEVPTVFVSLGNPYHLVDVPMMKTYINCYSNNAAVLDALLEKLTGRSEFKGTSPTDPFCGKPYLRY